MDESEFLELGVRIPQPEVPFTSEETQKIQQSLAMQLYTIAEKVLNARD